MKGMFAAVAFVLSVSVAAVLASENAPSTMPLFAWSAHSDKQSKPLSAHHAIASALNAGRPELVLVYMLNEVSTQDMQKAQGAFTNLQDTLENARSSSFAAVPLDKVDTESIMATTRANGAVGHEVQSSELQGFLANHAQLMQDGKPDVVLVRFPEATLDAASVDAVIGDAEKTVAASTEGKYSSILSTLSSMDMGAANNLAFQFIQGASIHEDVHYLNANATVLTSGTQAYAGNNGLYVSSITVGSAYYLTPTLLVSILVMIYMAFLIISSYCCLLNLQTPEKFEGDQEKEMGRALNQFSK